MSTSHPSFSLPVSCLYPWLRDARAPLLTRLSLIHSSIPHVSAYKGTRSHSQAQGNNCMGLSREEVTIKMPLAHSRWVRRGEWLG